VPASRVLSRDVLIVVATVLAIVAAHLLYARQVGDLTIQAQLNERFAERPIDVAFEKYPRLRPPLYPMALWAARRAGLSPPAFQVLAFDALLVGLALYGRRFLRRVHPGFLVAGFAVAHFNHANLYQRTAETLFAPLLLALVVVLWRYHVAGRGAAWLGAVASALCLTRHFGLFLAVPLAAAHVAFRRRRRATDPRRRVIDAALVLVLALAPIGYWMWITHEQTGLWTGADRTQPRDLPGSVEHWKELTGVDDHARLMAKTLMIDFFSPRVYAALAVVTVPHWPTAVEWSLLAMALAAAASALRAGRRAAWRGDGLAASPARIAAEVAAAYLGLTILLWTIGNNDPIHTRFLFPVYVLLWVLAFHAYDAVKEWSAAWWERLSWQLLYAGFVAVQLARSWRAEPLPVRYLW
jgi:hypothetical protein